MDDSGQEALLDEGLDQTQRQALYETWRDNPDLTADEIGSVADQYQALDDTAQSNLDGLIERQGADGATLARDLESDTLSGLLTCGSTTPSLGSSGASGGVVSNGQYPVSREPSLTVDDCTLDTDFLDSVARYNDEVDDFDAETFAQRYNELEGDNERQFRELTTNDEYGESWIRTVSSDSVDTEAIREAISQSDEVGDILRFRTATTVNGEFPADYADPYTSDSIVIEFQTTTERTYYRAHQSDNQMGGFIAREETVTDSEGNFLTQSEMQDTLSLPESPTRISAVEVPEGYELRVGEVQANFGGSEGAIQIELIGDEYIPSDDYVFIQELPTDG